MAGLRLELATRRPGSRMVSSLLKESQDNLYRSLNSATVKSPHRSRPRARADGATGGAQRNRSNAPDLPVHRCRIN